MFRIIFIRDSYDWGDRHGVKGFIFDPSWRGKPFDFCGYKVWSNSLHVFILRRNIFLMAEVLLHEIGHLVLHGVFLGGQMARRVNYWYDLVYWGVLRVLSKI